MKNLFIDSNIWLSLYHFTNDDLTQFQKLRELIGDEIRLIIPQQVRAEVFRNREAKLKDALKSFELTPFKYPAFCKGYSEFAQISSDYKDFSKRFCAWRKKIDEDIKAHNLPADQAIRGFFGDSDIIDCNEYIERAFTRYKIGNPPGKENKYGDAINWECLLDVIPDNEDLYFISADKDYRSELYDDQFSPFLLEEWTTKKHSKVFFYTNLVPFLSEHFKEIQLRTEQEKQSLILQLASSPNYKSTHKTIASMRQLSGWTEAQVEEICAIVDENNQVGWIFDDDDVISFYQDLLSTIPQARIKKGSSIDTVMGYLNERIEPPDGDAFDQFLV